MPRAKAEVTKFKAGPLTVTFKTTHNEIGIAVHDKSGRRLHFRPLSWAPSQVDVFGMAVRSGDLQRASSVLWFNFGRIDRYRDCPGLLDAWKVAERVA